jgi:hypothetical protein
MAGEDLQIVRLRTDFYRDGFSKMLIAIAIIVIAVIMLCALSVYLFVSKPDPVYFATDNDFRVVAPVPLNVPYISDPDLYQWVSVAIPAAFTYDFLNYNVEQQEVTQYFTTNGWQNLLGHLSNFHVDFNALQNTKTFVTAQITGAPFILSQSNTEAKYTWDVQIPMNLSYSNARSTLSLVIVARVVRVPTLDNLNGVAIDSMTITSSQGNQANKNG